MSESIDHSGRIEKIEGDTIFVKITQQSACSGCHAKGICIASDQKEKVIEVNSTDCGKYHVGEEVMISARSSLGLQAVLLAFVLPLIIVVVAIAVGPSLEWDETTSGITGLLLLAPYYCILYLLREKLKRKFIFTLKKLN